MTKRGQAVSFSSYRVAAGARLIVLAGGYFVFVKPQHAKSARSVATSLHTQRKLDDRARYTAHHPAQRAGASRRSLPTCAAMPDQLDIADVLLDLNAAARNSGVVLDRARSSRARCPDWRLPVRSRLRCAARRVRPPDGVPLRLKQLVDVREDNGAQALRDRPPFGVDSIQFARPATRRAAARRDARPPGVRLRERPRPRRDAVVLHDQHDNDDVVGQRERR